MKTTITEEFDGEGRLTKRTTVTDGEYATGGYLPRTGTISVPSCTCSQPWGSVLPPPPCPAHGQAQGPIVVSHINADTSPQQIAEQVGWMLRTA